MLSKMLAEDIVNGRRQCKEELDGPMILSAERRNDLTERHKLLTDELMFRHYVRAYSMEYACANHPEHSQKREYVE